jgi:hypothetical protein
MDIASGCEILARLKAERDKWSMTLNEATKQYYYNVGTAQSTEQLMSAMNQAEHRWNAAAKILDAHERAHGCLDSVAS